MTAVATLRLWQSIRSRFAVEPPPSRARIAGFALGSSPARTPSPQVLCAQGRDPKGPLRQLLYPLVQVCVGVAKLLPNIRFAPLRFQ